MTGKISLIGLLVTLAAAFGLASTANAQIYYYYRSAPYGYYGAAPTTPGPYWYYAPNPYGGRTYDWYKRDFQLRGRDGA